jgi:hypothetical protein
LKYELIILEEALADLETAYWWYDSEVSGLGEELISEWEIASEFIRKYPWSAIVYKGSIRQARMMKFPFFIMYEVIETQVVVYSVVDNRMHPRKRNRIRK